MEMQKRNVVYIYDADLVADCDRIPVIKSRASRVHDLISSYELLSTMTVIASRPATRDDLLSCHSSQYVNYLQQHSGHSDSDNENDNDGDVDAEFGLSYDCPKLPDMWAFCRRIAGGTVTAADELLKGGVDVAVNWCGGWHHAQRDLAAGFCYVNDIVIGIQRLSQRFDRILYLDLDVHHGDGVENAFWCTKRVMTLSFHQFEPGFYPGSGDILDNGFGAAQGYALNFPYKEHMSGERFTKYFKIVLLMVLEIYAPEAVVLQCGADVITGDKLGNANVTPKQMGDCLDYLLANFKGPLLVLGGGGYNLENTARYWTHLTGIICGVDLDNDLPDNDHFLDYGPSYELHVDAKRISDPNTDEELDKNVDLIRKFLDKVEKTE